MGRERKSTPVIPSPPPTKHLRKAPLNQRTSSGNAQGQASSTEIVQVPQGKTPTGPMAPPTELRLDTSGVTKHELYLLWCMIHLEPKPNFGHFICHKVLQASEAKAHDICKHFVVHKHQHHKLFLAESVQETNWLLKRNIDVTDEEATRHIESHYLDNDLEEPVNQDSTNQQMDHDTHLNTMDTRLIALQAVVNLM
ncbi:hypothetical protein E3N88_18094 [Mikania micrantha]|uniref:Uncharacterized protein n=1 Tax=Mikania micrantha TaxID=192012 RepID=A0A5N6NWF8_9ASTR|nr:hypothetical protein E3N88_18094 [Mikania micrantha]